MRGPGSTFDIFFGKGAVNGAAGSACSCCSRRRGGDLRRRLSRIVARPLCEFCPASADQVLGVVGRHFDCSIGADVDVSAGEGLRGADADEGS